MKTRIATLSLLAFVAALTALASLFGHSRRALDADSPFGPTSLLRPSSPIARG
ncbi:MAG TPA: hypothetical protein VEA63_13135 [Opitutus sp.]|nr:hypothetical protein [Opitutus sp.]